MSIRPAHPGVRGRRGWFSHIDCPDRSRVLVSEQNFIPALKDLEWVWHVTDAGNSGKIALQFRIVCEPCGVISLPGFQGGGKVWNGAAFHNSNPWRFRVLGAKNRYAALGCRV